jgi:hypothetical protein
MLIRRLLCIVTLAGLMTLGQRAHADECTDPTAGGPGTSTWLEAFHQRHFQPIPGAERRLPNGVAWRVVIDATTRLAQLRITWMADRWTMARANRYFDRVMACTMINYYGRAMKAYAYHREGEEIPFHGSVPGGYIESPVERLTLSYATPRLVSGFGVDVDYQYAKPAISLWSFVFDVENERNVEIEACSPLDGPFTLATPFRIGRILDLCDPAAHAAFVALWSDRIGALAQTAFYRKHAGTLYCAEHRLDLAPPRFRFATYALTEQGLAVHTGYLDPSSQRCLLEKSPFNPVIVPWRDLEPWLVPGPLRDELLRQRRP